MMVHVTLFVMLIKQVVELVVNFFQMAALTHIVLLGLAEPWGGVGIVGIVVVVVVVVVVVILGLFGGIRLRGESGR